MFWREPPIALDLLVGDVLAALQACCSSAPPREPLEDDSVTCLSVRSGFDLFLRERAFARGSEVLVGAITHPGMVDIILHHGLVPVTVDLDPETLAPHPEALARAVTPRAVAVLVAHLFGGRFDVAPLVAFCREHSLLLLEDCAQAFCGGDYRGDPAAAISMFSFGPLKTSTALGGALIRVSDAALRARMRQVQAGDSVDTNLAYARRVVKYGILGIGLSRLGYSLLAAILERKGTPLIEISRRWLHAFPGPFQVTPLRRRPAPALVRMLARRLRTFDAARLARRAASGERSLAQMQDVEIPGRGLMHRTWWLFPVLVKQPEGAMRTLRRAGFEAVPGLSNLIVLGGPPSRPELDPWRARRIVDHAILVPVHPAMSAPARLRLSELVRSLALRESATVPSAPCS